MTVEVKPDDPFLVQKEPRDEAASDGAGKGPDAFRTIGEAAAELGLKTHVLRFWETKFDALAPLKRADGRRYYRPDDMEILRRLQSLLHVQGLTIRGAIKVINGQDGHEADLTASADDADPAELAAAGVSVRDLQDAVRGAVERGEFRAEEAAAADPARERLEALLADLSSLKSRLDRVRSAA